MPNYVLAFLVAVVASYILTPQVIQLAKKIGAMDAPDARKVHVQPVPRLGGLAIYFAFMIAMFCTVEITTEIIGLIIGATIIVIVGIIDDLKNLPARVKLLGQIIAAAVMVLFDIRIDWITNPFGGYIFDDVIYLEYLAVPVTLFWIVGLTNTVNLIDGLDGLAAGVSMIASITILLVALQQNDIMIAVLMAALAGSAFGFLHYNFNPAKIFMGDTGSMFLGYILAGVSILGAVKSAATIALIVPIFALGLPILDTTFAIVRRYMSGKPIFKPDRGHLHHRLLDLGFTQKQAVLLMYVISGMLGLSAIALTEVSSGLAIGIVLAVIAAVVFGAKKLGILKTKKSVETHQ